jgi:hypothetical protein
MLLKLKRVDLLPRYVAKLILTYFPGRTHNSGVQKCFQIFGLNFFGQSQQYYTILVDFLCFELTKNLKLLLHTKFCVLLEKHVES